MQKLTTDIVVARFKEVHGIRYDYSMVNYENAHTKLQIICDKHGPFFQTAHAHLKSSGCITCELERRSKALRLPRDECITRLHMKYNNFYDYTDLHYTNMHEYVTVNCPIHGPFDVYLDHHLNRGDKCPVCSVNGKSVYNETIFKRNKGLAETPGIFYVIKLESEHESFYKFGITKNCVSVRYHQSGTGPYKRSTVLEEPMTLYEAFTKEQECKKHLEQYIPQHKFDGYTECVKEWT